VRKVNLNAPGGLGLAPVRSEADVRGIPIDAVGVADLRYPVTILSGGWEVLTIAYVSMTVALPAAVKATHMSRFVELLEMQDGALDQRGFRAMVRKMLEQLDARTGTIEMRFPYFVRKAAPVSGLQSHLDYDVRWRGSVDSLGMYSFLMGVGVPVISSAYGAHNRRSRVAIDALAGEDVRIEELIAIAEESASSQVYGLLKRRDEKFVTQMADDNPRFVEDLVRDVAVALDRDARISGYTVEARSFESIHNHSAFARVVRAPGG
jgi:GTP cyclohydrolase I